MTTAGIAGDGAASQGPPDLETICAHLGSDHADSERGPFQVPIAQSTVFNLGTPDDAEALFSGTRAGYAYTRFGNPTVDVLAQALARLEGGAEAVVTSSGNAAVHCAIAMALQDSRGPIVASSDLYGGSCEVLEILRSTFGLPVEFVDAMHTDRWHEAVSRAGVVLFETPSNPLMRLVDIAATVAAARTAGAAVVVDNTVATPYNQQPIALGADFVVHSTSKFLNGHSDMIGGCVVAREAFSPAAKSVHKNFGATVNALDAWLTLRGLRTFALRMQAHNHNGLAVARWLRERPEVTQVHFPGLSGDEDIFRRQMRHGSSLLSFELRGGEQAARQFLSRIRVILHAVSLGGMESLATTPATTSHRGMTVEQRRRAGLGDGLVRLSVGVESIDALITDLEQAISGGDEK